MAYNTRKSNERKAPQRYEDLTSSSPSATKSPQDENVRSSHKLPPLSQLEPSQPSKRVRGKYRGPQIEFNPNRSPCAFPSLDFTSDDVPVANQPDGESLFLDFDSGEQELILSRGFNNSKPDDPRQHLSEMFSVPSDGAAAGLRRRGPPPYVNGSPTSPSAGSNLSGQGLGRNDNGPNNPTYMRNMRLLEGMDQRTEFDDYMDEMATSDEDEPAETVAHPLNTTSWDDLSIAVKLDLVDEVNEVSDDATPEDIMNMLQLSELQKAELTQLLIQRKDREVEEKRNSKLLNEHTREVLHSGRNITSEESRDMMDRTIWRSAKEDNYVTASRAEARKGEDYLRRCGIDPSILGWDRPLSSESFAQRNRSTYIPTLRSESSSLDEDPSRSLQSPSFVPSQYGRVVDPGLPNLGGANYNARQPRPSSHGRRETSESINAHSSLAAPPAVPMRISPVAPMQKPSQLPYLAFGNQFSTSLQHGDRDRYALQANTIPSSKTSSVQLPTPPVDHSPLPASLGIGARTMPNINQIPTASDAGSGSNKRKRSSGGSATHGTASGTRTPSTAAAKRTKKDEGG